MAVGTDDFGFLQFAENDGGVCGLSKKVGNVSVLLCSRVVVVFHDVVGESLPAIRTRGGFLDEADEFLDGSTTFDDSVGG